MSATITYMEFAQVHSDYFTLFETKCQEFIENKLESP